MIDTKTANMLVESLVKQEGGPTRKDLAVIDKAYRKAMVRSQLAETIDPKRAKPDIPCIVSRRVLVNAIENSSALDLQTLATKVGVPIQNIQGRGKRWCGCCGGKPQKANGKQVMLPIAALTVSAVPSIASSL